MNPETDTLLFESLPVTIDGFQLRVRVWNCPNFLYWGSHYDTLVLEHYWDGPEVYQHVTRELPILSQDLQKASRYIRALHNKQIYKSASLVKTNTSTPLNWVYSTPECCLYGSQIERDLTKRGF